MGSGCWRKSALPLRFPEIRWRRNQKLGGQRRWWRLISELCAGLPALPGHVMPGDSQIGAGTGVTCFLCFTLSPPLSYSPLPPSLLPPLKFFGHLHPSINCQCSSTAINQLFVSSCQSARDLCQLLLLITRRVRLEGEKREGERRRGRKRRGETGVGGKRSSLQGWEECGGSKKKNERGAGGAQCQENE